MDNKELRTIRLSWTVVEKAIQAELKKLLGINIECKASADSWDYWSVVFKNVRLNVEQLKVLFKAFKLSERDKQRSMPETGKTDTNSLSRLQSQVLIHNPDLVIVCFGLNDVNLSLEDYINSLRTIFLKIQKTEADLIFMTPNMLNTYVADDVAPVFKNYAQKAAIIQNEGRMDTFMESAVELANELGVCVCDCYKKWKELSKTKDTTMLLANRINHPIREMHELFANSLFEIIFDEAAPSTK